MIQRITLDSATQYRDREFATSLHVLAVSEFVSRLRIFGRFLGQIEKGDLGRYTVRDAHDRSYRALPDSVGAVANAATFDSITLYDLHGQVLAQVDRNTAGAATRLREAMEHERDPRRLDQAELLEVLDRWEQLAGRYHRVGVLRDIAEYRVDLLRTTSAI